MWKLGHNHLHQSGKNLTFAPLRGLMGLGMSVDGAEPSRTRALMTGLDAALLIGAAPPNPSSTYADRAERRKLT